MAEVEPNDDQSIEDILCSLVRLKEEHQQATDTFRQRIDDIERKLKERKPPTIESR